MTITIRHRIAAAAAVALGAGAAFGILVPPAARATTITFAQACSVTHGWLATVPGAGIEECHWQDPNTGNEWIERNPIGAAPVTASGSTFGQACIVTHGWIAQVPAAGIEQCHWQDHNTGDEHIVSNPLPKKPTVPKVTPPSRSTQVAN